MKLFYTSSIKLPLWELINQSTDKVIADENATILLLRFISNILEWEPFCKYCSGNFCVPLLCIFFSFKYSWIRFDMFGLFMENVFIFRIKSLQWSLYMEDKTLCSSSKCLEVSTNLFQRCLIYFNSDVLLLFILYNLAIFRVPAGNPRRRGVLSMCR